MEPTTTDTAAFVPPRRIGRYEIVGELGRGAMGVVHKGFDPTIGRTVAIKTVHASATSEDILKRFRREAQAAGVLSHPNIVTIYDAGEDQGVFYIAMEFVEGETLEKLIGGGPMALETATSIVEDVGSALDHAHARDIIHRDIKPANIMITQGGRAKVMDFGVAKLTSSTATANGMVVGTPSYMSPEAVKGAKVDGRSDIFSLGVVLYEMVTAKRPFPGDSIPSVIYKIIGEHPAPPTTVNPTLHTGLDIVLAKALAKDPADRYSHCVELVKDLRNFRELQAPQLGTATATGTDPSTPQVLRTLAPPLVSGTVALSPETVAIPRAAVASTPQAPPPPALPPASPRKSWLAPLLVVGLLAAAAIGGGVWWKQQQAAQRAQQEQAAAAQSAALQKVQATSDAAKPNPAGDAAGSLDVLVRSSIAGAAISLDGKTDPSWITPHQIRVPFGSHEIAVSKSGYRPMQDLKDFSSNGPADLMFRLQPAEGATTKAEKPAKPLEPKKAAEPPPPPIPTVDGRLRVITFPPNADVTVDGAGKYHTPVNILLPAGKHKIAIKHKRTSDYSRDMIVVGNEIVEMNVNLFNPDKPIPPQQQRRFP